MSSGTQGFVLAGMGTFRYSLQLPGDITETKPRMIDVSSLQQEEETSLGQGQSSRPGLRA